MRPSILNPLFSDLRSLKGIGQRVEERFTALLPSPGGQPGSAPKIIHLLWHFPSSMTDRSARPQIAQTEEGQIATLGVTVLRHNPPANFRSRAPYRVICEDESAKIELTFFSAKQSWLEDKLPVGETRYISGKVEKYDDRFQMLHPDYIVSADKLDDLPTLEPVYPLTYGLNNKMLQKTVKQALGKLPDGIGEWQDKPFVSKKGWPSFCEALYIVHLVSPDAETANNAKLPLHEARMRLAYDELLAHQLALSLTRQKIKQVDGRCLKGTGKVSQKIYHALEFELTGDQKKVLDEIALDMEDRSKMLRLLQGDVGSGKTVVALLAMAKAIESGTQAAIMAPTEVLARQHFISFEEIAQKAGLRIALLTGRDKGRKRTAKLLALMDGDIDIMIGTHALFQEDVLFKDLGLVIIDEQHRFGVHQRLALQEKGVADMLVMTATPIPRTLLLTHYGDMDISIIREKPPGRLPVQTALKSNDKIDEIIARLGSALENGVQVYWVCPLVSESEKLDLQAAEKRFEGLYSQFGAKVGMVHGKMKPTEKDLVMDAFKAGELSILVATTVIEVGVNVPNASIMVIEHAERFGLSQLHQLRGRVGRGNAQSTCLLIYQGPLSKTAGQRLSIMRQTEDGFRIAEEDLKIRGGGAVLGTRQSGQLPYNLANPEEHEELLQIARDDARLILNIDPDLASARGQALQILLHLFEIEEAAFYLKAG